MMLSTEPSLRLESDHEADASVSSYGSGSNQEDGTEHQMKNKNGVEIAQKETTAVWIMRFILLLALVCFALLVSLAVYFILEADEQDDFEKQFVSDANKILEGIGSSLDGTLGAMDAYISRMVAQTQMLNASFPFVTVPGFGVQAAKLLKLSKAYQFATVHFVTREERDQWEEYASENNGWIDETIQVQNNNDEWWGPTLEDYQPIYEILQFTAQGIGLVGEPKSYMNNYAVAWQNAPLLEGLHSIPYNFDQWGGTATNDMLEAVNTKKVIIAKSPNILSDPDNAYQVAHMEQLAEINQLFLPPDQDATEPVTAVIYPIVNSLDSVRIDITKDDPVVGLLLSVAYWRELIKNILPDNSVGLVVVFEASCGDLFTYQLDGPETTYLGAGDLHDSKYDHLEILARFADIMDTVKLERGSSYTGLPLNDEYCSRTVRIFPSQTTEDQHTTKKPVILAVLSALIFVFTSLIFIIYDWLVARRQRIVHNRAKASSAIVSSLFPEKVAKQLYEEREEKQQQKESNLKSFMDDFGGEAKSSSPIADLYPATSILFADLAGFTKWSAAHTPADVFTMLEAFYSAFDELANKRGVFKVETVGDCYVAVTGIPDPRKDHATCMCRFAWECMARMNEIKVDLAETLGSDTLNLQFRVGIHSGSVIAGVLRGEKGRFQLFGDTMNTASRMESTGVPGCIHVSEDTANELRARGKSHWLTPREEKIVAKGKGEMQTYFVAFKYAKSTLSMSSTSLSMSSDNGEEEGMDSNYDNIQMQDIEELEKKLNGGVSRDEGEGKDNNNFYNVQMQDIDELEKKLNGGGSRTISEERLEL